MDSKHLRMLNILAIRLIQMNTQGDTTYTWWQ